MSNSERWSIKVTNLKASVDKADLARLLNIDPAFLYIPRARNGRRFYGWINSFGRKQDADIFVNQMSNTFYEGQALKFSVRPLIKTNEELDDLDEDSGHKIKPDNKIEESPVTGNTKQGKLCIFAKDGICEYADGACKFRHEKCSQYDSCTNNNCSFAHAPKLCDYQQYCTRTDCRYLHRKRVRLTGAKFNFLDSFRDSIWNNLREVSGIKEMNWVDDGLELLATSSAVRKVEVYLNRQLHVQTIEINNQSKKYLGLVCRVFSLKTPFQQGHVAISYPDNNDLAKTNNIHLNVSDESENDFPDALDVIPSESSANKNASNRIQRNIQVELCSDSEDSLSRAVKELVALRRSRKSWKLNNEEVEFILTHSKPIKSRRNQTKSDNRNRQIKFYLERFLKSYKNCIVFINVSSQRDVNNVNLFGFQSHVKLAADKIQQHLSSIVVFKEIIYVSKVIGIFLKIQCSSEVNRLQQEYKVKLTVLSSSCVVGATSKHNDDDCHIELSGPAVKVKIAKEKMNDFLESLIEREEQFPCATESISKITESIIKRLERIQKTNDTEAIGSLILDKARKKESANSQIMISFVGRNKEAVDNTIEECRDIIEGCSVWKPNANEFRSIRNTFDGGKCSISEFCERWGPAVQLEINADTITICAESKSTVEEIKKALLNLDQNNRITVKRTSKTVIIPENISVLLKRSIRDLVEKAKSQNITLDYHEQNKCTINGPSNAVMEFENMINLKINDIKQSIIERTLILPSAASDFLRSDNYKVARNIERRTNTFIHISQSDRENYTSERKDSYRSIAIASAVNSRDQTIILEKGDITKIKYVDAIVNATNGTLIHAAGVDRMISNAAGPLFDKECMDLIAKNRNLPFPAGVAVKTNAGNLPFKSIIHAIGPQYIDGNSQERPLLFFSILSSLRIAEEHNYESLALPAVCAKTYDFPVVDCTHIVVRAIKQFFADYPQSKLRKVILIDIDETACYAFERELLKSEDELRLNDDEDIIQFQSTPPLEVRWCWKSDEREELYNDNDTRRIETAFQQHLNNSQTVFLELTCDNTEFRTVFNYEIYFKPELRVLKKDTNLQDFPVVCGYQLNKITQKKRDIIRYKLKPQENSIPTSYRPKPIDVFTYKRSTEEIWKIVGTENTQVNQAVAEIKKEIDVAMTSDVFHVTLDNDFSTHKNEISKIALQYGIEATCSSEHLPRVDVTLKGLKLKVFEAKFEISQYSNNILKIAAETNNGLEPPDEWDAQNENCKLTEIPQIHPDFNRILTRMRETMKNVRIHKIERVQNLELWRSYAFNRKKLSQAMSSKPYIAYELELFHGTSSTLPNEIYNSDCGFDMRFCTKGLWGIGTYFSRNASYSCTGYAYKLPNGMRQVFLAHVLTGDVHQCPHDPTLRMPPKKHDTTSGVRYDSVSGETGGSIVYVVYENRVAYPTYLITFTEQ